MLTKDLLKVSLRKGCIHPEFVDPKDMQAQILTRRLLAIVNGSKGQTQSYIEEALQDEIERESLSYASGFVKLILDHLEYSETQGDCESVRWNLIKTAQSLRQEQYFKSKEEFQETLESLFSKSFKFLSENLYSDLPDFKQMNSSLDWNEEDFIYRYNCALVQSLFLIAPKVDLRISFTSAVEKRHLFRAIKFHRLVVGNINFDANSLSFSIDGPMSLLVNTQAYGMRLANFFPRLLLLKHWQIDAAIVYKKKSYLLSLNEDALLKSHYKEWGDYRPEEFEEFLKAFNNHSSAWRCEWCDELISLGSQDFCFPDMSFVNVSTGQKIHLELFHRWHRGELDKRVRILQKSDKVRVIIGVCNSLIKQDSIGIKEIDEKSFEKFGFIFRGVPTPKAVNVILNQVLSVS